MLEPLKNLLNEIEADCAKFQNGNNAAGTRVRVKSMDLIKAAKALRQYVAAQKEAKQQA